MIRLKITNPRRALVKRITLSMIEYDQIAVDKYRNSILKVILPKIIKRTDEKIKEVFYLIISSVPLPPYYQYIGGIEETTNIRVRYFLKSKVKVKDLFTNFDIIVPIILETGPKPDTSQQQVLDPSTREKVSLKMAQHQVTIHFLYYIF